MTAFFSDVAFNINSINFNTPFAGPHEYGSDGAFSVNQSLPPLVIGTATYTVPNISVSWEEELYVYFGRDSVNGLFGSDLTYTEGGVITGGTAQVMSAVASTQTLYGFLGFALPAAEFSQAAQSSGTADDRAYVTRILAGNDLISLSTFNDVFNSGLGRDLIVDEGGNDRINAGGGNDLVIAAKGNDRVDGSLGNDVVIGGVGNDALAGGTGADVIWAGVGADTATGGTGADAFLFKAGDGTLEITDFNAADDQLLFMGPNSGLANLSLSQVARGVQVTFSDVSVLLVGMTLSQVSTADVAVGGNAALNTATGAFFDDWTFLV